jgi:hypothetical protein
MAKYSIMRSFLLIAFLFTGFSSPLFAQQLVKVPENVFKPGEELSYRLKYGFFTAATADIKVENSDIKFEGNPAYHIVALGQTAGTFDFLYKVRNRYETYVDEKTLLPYYYAENRHESSYKHTDKVTFNHETDKITADKGTFAFKGQVFDFLSAYYFARNLDVTRMKIGEKFDLQYFLEDGIHTLTITYVGKEKTDCSLGTFNCYKFNPTIIPGRIFRKDSKLYLWITADGNRIPIKAHVEVVVGSLTMDLQDAKNLKYPLNPVK